VSVFGGDNIARRMVLENLNAARRDFQSVMAKTLGFKHTPVLLFRIDNRVAAGDRVLELLAEMEHSSAAEDGENNE
jgi:ribosome-binding factor A